jgi:hypothetical protein
MNSQIDQLTTRHLVSSTGAAAAVTVRILSNHLFLSIKHKVACANMSIIYDGDDDVDDDGHDDQNDYDDVKNIQKVIILLSRK